MAIDTHTHAHHITHIDFWRFLTLHNRPFGQKVYSELVASREQILHALCPITQAPSSLRYSTAESPEVAYKLVYRI